MNKTKIQKLFEENCLDEAMRLLDEMPADDAWALFMRGRIAWKFGRRGEAISYYEKAVEADPQSPAAVALSQARNVMDFYSKDLLNP